MSRRHELRPDSPLESPEQDQLGYAGFAEDLAETILHRTPTNGYTIGINGPWGSGKSTILYFIEHYLEKSDQNPAIVRFNPWWFSGEADLLDKFLTQIAVTLESEDGFPDVRSKMAKLSGALSNVPFEALTGVPAGRGFAALASVLEEDGQSIEDLKEEIEAELENVEQEIVVIIDDIDRLTPEEVTQMFQIIKNIADFPNTVYILSFDQAIVSDSLKTEANIDNGEEYIQKIVQLPLDIPEPRGGALEELFTYEIRNIPDDFTVEEERWDSLLRSGVMQALDTPRDVTRLTNTIDVMTAAVGEEVNFCDLVGLETLRVFYPEVHDEIKDSPDRFVGYRRTSGRFGSGSDPDQYDDILGELDGEDREVVESILSNLFPFARDNLLDQYSTRSMDEMRVNKRICHPDRFPVYFRLSIPEGQLSSAEIGSIMASLNDPEDLTEDLNELLEEEGIGDLSKSNVFLHRLHERIDEVEAADAEPLLTALFEVGDELILQIPERSRGREAVRMTSLIGSVLDQVDEDDKLSTIKSALSSRDSVILAAYLLRSLLREHGEYDADPLSENERMFEMDEISEVQEIIAEGIAERASRGDMLELPWLEWSLDFWADSSHSDELEEWVDGVVETDEGLLTFIDRMSSTTIVNRTTPVKYIDPRWLDEYIDPDVIEERIASIDREEIDDDQIEIVERFETGMEMLEEGEDPGSSENWIFGRTRN